MSTTTPRLSNAGALRRVDACDALDVRHLAKTSALVEELDVVERDLCLCWGTVHQVNLCWNGRDSVYGNRDTVFSYSDVTGERDKTAAGFWDQDVTMNTAFVYIVA